MRCNAHNFRDNTKRLFLRIDENLNFFFCCLIVFVFGIFLEYILCFIYMKNKTKESKKKNGKMKSSVRKDKWIKIINMYRNSIGWCLQLSLVSSLDRLEYWSDDDSSLILGWAPPLWSLFNMVLRICWIDIAAGFDWSINILSPSHSLSLYCRTFLCFS